jgi:hypothetical protein
MLPVVLERFHEFQPTDILTIIIAAKTPEIKKREVKRALIEIGLKSIQQELANDRANSLVAFEIIRAIKNFIYKEYQKM